MAAGTPVYPGDSNSFVPSHESTQGLIIDFSRNPDDFKINRYVKLIPVDKTVGLYARFGKDGGFPEEAARITDTGLANFEWPDAGDAPDGKSTRELFQYVDYRTHRRAFPWQLGDIALGQTSWNIRNQYSRMMASLAMLARVQKTATLLTTSGNWPASHTIAVSSISGNTGKWDVSTSVRQDIRRSIDYGVNAIRLDTLGVVKREDLILVLNPQDAEAMSRSQEIVDFLKQQSNSIKIIEGKWDQKNFQFPGELYGVQVEIEDAVKVTNAKGATRAASYVWPAASAALVARPGELIATDAQAPNFATASVFVWKEQEMLTEEFHDDRHKRTDGRVVDTTDYGMTAPASGFLFTAATG